MAKASTVVDCHVSLSPTVSLTNVTNVNDPLRMSKLLILDVYGSKPGKLVFSYLIIQHDQGLDAAVLGLLAEVLHPPRRIQRLVRHLVSKLSNLISLSLTMLK